MSCSGPAQGTRHSPLRSAGDFRSTLSQTVGCQRVPFDFSSSFVSTYFGPKRTLELDYLAFTQLLQVRAFMGGGAVVWASMGEWLCSGGLHGGGVV